MNEEATTDQFYDLADEYMREKRYEDATALYEKLVEMNPGEDSLIMSLSWAYRESGRVEDAVDCLRTLFEKELVRKVFTGFAFDELVRIFRDEEKHDRLVDICERTVAAQPEDVDLLSTLGDAYLRAGQADKAVDVFKKVISMEPDSPTFFVNFGNVLIAAGDFDGAENAYNMAVAIDPSEAPLFYNKLGDTYYKAEHYEKAEKAYRKSLKYRSDSSLCYCDLGDVLVKQGKIEEANNAYENAIRINPESAAIFYNRFGNTLATDMCHRQAINIFEKAIAADPQNPFYYLRLAESCTAEGFIEMAEKALQQAKLLKEIS
jgi:tetratricopeptide (TPR) repeat protein